MKLSAPNCSGSKTLLSSNTLHVCVPTRYATASDLPSSHTHRAIWTLCPCALFVPRCWDRPLLPPSLPGCCRTRSGRQTVAKSRASGPPSLDQTLKAADPGPVCPSETRTVAAARQEADPRQHTRISFPIFLSLWGRGSILCFIEFATSYLPPNGELQLPRAGFGWRGPEEGPAAAPWVPGSLGTEAG